MTMKRLPAGEFKAKCLSLMDEVMETGEEIIITKRGQPVARLVPALPEKPTRIWGCREGTVEILGDIVASTGEEWDAES
jgi:prevent-host-death family protein